MDLLKTATVRVLLAILATLSLGMALGMTAAAAAPKPAPPVPEAPLPEGMTRAELDAARAKALAAAVEASKTQKSGAVSTTGAIPGGATTMAVTGWINISRSQGSINCNIEARQNGSNWWQTRVLPGGCRSIYIEAYVYNSQYMADLDWQIGGLSGGRTFESRSPQKLCYIYVYWRDGANVFRDVVFWDGGSQF